MIVGLSSPCPFISSFIVSERLLLAKYLVTKKSSFSPFVSSELLVSSSCDFFDLGLFQAKGFTLQVIG